MNISLCVCVGCQSGSIRIVGSNLPWQGRVEVCKLQAWGTVCDAGWTQEDSDVACRQAGFSGQGTLIIDSQNYRT